MNLSMKWLADYVDCGVSVKEFCAGMTMSGSKVETYETEGDAVKNVIVGKLVSITPHENSDHLQVCQVDVGGDAPIQIVTGAQNIVEGALVPVAMIGADLPGGVHIKKGKLRGVESNGMLCSLGELGLTKHDFPYAIEDGIFLIEEDCKPGQDIHEAIGLNDTSVEFEITSNRPDCLSVVGLAREAAVTFGKPLNLKAPEFHGSEDKLSDSLAVAVENTQLCPRYIAGMVKNVKIGPSPRWMRERLRASGVRPINNLVDITNYVMLEYGQPMHAFDQRYVKDGKIVVRNAKDGEAITTLDGQERQLSPEMLIIADAEKPIAVAGVMGGEYSGIMDDTNTVIFESAYFEPVQVRRTAKKLGMRTDASARYEKGLDPDGCQRTLKRAMELVELLGAGEPVAEFIEVDNRTAKPAEIPFDPDWINRFLGTEISREEMVKTLESLDIQVKGDVCVSPSFRIDLERPADIAEEVARIYGYNNIPTTTFRGAATEGGYTEAMKLENRAGSLCRSLGYSEILTYSFVSPSIFDQIRLPEDSSLRNAMRIQNPLGEDASIMRTVALPSMLAILARNNAYHNDAVKLYELAKVYLPKPGQILPDEPKHLVLGTYGEHEDFFKMKGEIEAFLRGMNVPEARYTAEKHDPTFHPGRCARVSVGGVDLGCFGQIHPLVARSYGIDGEIFAAELNFTALLSLQLPEKTYTPLPKYPAVTRDIAVVCDEAVTVAALSDCIRAAGGKLLRSVELFDIYRGKGIASGSKSAAFRLTLRADDRTLTDADSDGVVSAVLAALEKELNAKLR